MTLGSWPRVEDACNRTVIGGCVEKYSVVGPNIAHKRGGFVSTLAYHDQHPIIDNEARVVGTSGSHAFRRGVGSHRASVAHVATPIYHLRPVCIERSSLRRDFVVEVGEFVHPIQRYSCCSRDEKMHEWV